MKAPLCVCVCMFVCMCVLFQMEERRDSMLETAFQCFQGASRCEGDSDEEEWLIHYMLGKIAEKRKQPPVEYLQLYNKVNSCGDFRRHIYQSSSISS